MRTHLSAIAALVPHDIPVFDTAAERPNYNPLNWTGAWTSAQRAAWELPERYVVLTAPTLRTRAWTLDDVPRDIRDYVRLMIVDPTARGARSAQESIRNTLNRSHPVVAGFSTDLRHSSGDVFARDSEAPNDLYYAVDTYLYHATPAPIPPDPED